MKTGCYFTNNEPGRICISRSVPKGFEHLPRYEPLIPYRHLLSLADKGSYARGYFGNVLGKLDAQQVWDDLHRLAGGHEPVICCWERLEREGEWCHRRMVAAWFKRELGIEVAEIQTEKMRRAAKQLNLFAA